MRIKNKRNAFCNTEKLQSKIDVLFHIKNNNKFSVAF